MILGKQGGVQHEVVVIIIKNNSQSVLKSLREDFDIPVDASCGGRGTCGKCKVRVLRGEIDEPGEEERRHLSDEDIHRGYRLACKITPRDELHLSLDWRAGSFQILEGHHGFVGELNPLVLKKYLSLEEPGLDDWDAELGRILKALELPRLKVSLPLRRRIPVFLRETAYSFTAVYNRDALISLEPGDTSSENYAMACDIGTTTVVIYLLDASTGEIVDTKSELNVQRSFGADVLARIDFTMNRDEGLQLLQGNQLSQLNAMAQALLETNRIEGRNLSVFTIAGNTTMLHLLSGVDPSGIGKAPFTPAFLGGFSCYASELGNFFTDCLFYFLPSLSAYVGADLLAGVLAVGMNESDELSLLVDLGTNGEIIIGNREGFYSCSTAVGPAFEGAHISCGMGAVSGAVNSVVINNKIRYTTIGDTPAVGFCGSAIVDIVSQFLKRGIIDETGRFADAEDGECETIKELFLGHYNGGDHGGFTIVPAEESGTGTPLMFTQRDIREVQLAKAAISAGIETLLHESGKTKDDVIHLYMAGGFGNYINRESAASIGLIPRELLDRAVSVGNTAGLGAIGCALSHENLTACEGIAKKTTYIELSNNLWFQQKYMEEMGF